MRILEWNVAHQTRQKPLPAAAGLALASLSPDVVVLTEYVAAESHLEFRKHLVDCGLEYVDVSPHVDGQNQVLVASRWPFTPGRSRPPDTSPAALPNWFHLRLHGPSLDLIACRVPMFKASQARRQYWDWLEAALLGMDQPVVLVGDLNVDPSRERRVGGAHLARLSMRGWTIVTPADGWSFIGKTGHTARIDHGVASGHFRIEKPDYVVQAAGFTFAGTREYSDHAVLRVDVAKAS